MPSTGSALPALLTHCWLLSLRMRPARTPGVAGKLDLPQDGDTHRRVLAVVTYLGASAA